MSNSVLTTMHPLELLVYMDVVIMELKKVTQHNTNALYYFLQIKVFFYIVLFTLNMNCDTPL